jgi:hypothetical protein
MTRHLHHVAAKSSRQRHRQHNLVALSPALLCVYIVSWPSHPDSIITSKTRQHHRQHDSTSHSAITSMTQHHRCQHDLASMTCNGLIININTIRLQLQADTLLAHTGTTHQHTWFQGQCKHLIVLLGTSTKHLHFDD